MIGRAIGESGVRIETDSARAPDPGESDLGEELARIMRAQGIDPADWRPQDRELDAAAVADLQTQILGALARHSIVPDAGGRTSGAAGDEPAESDPGSGEPF